MNAKPEKKPTGVVLDKEMMEYVDELARRSERSRSWMINFLIRQHAKSNGQVQNERQPELSIGVITA
jgi:predicted transcriptional regulator